MSSVETLPWHRTPWLLGIGVAFLVLIMLGRAIRAGDIVQHRRWMIRTFANDVAVGTIRIWLALFLVTGLLDFSSAIGPAFWISLPCTLWLPSSG